MFHQFVKDNGWSRITDIYEQSWDAKECSVTTIDGSILRFLKQQSATEKNLAMNYFGNQP